MVLTTIADAQKTEISSSFAQGSRSDRGTMGHVAGYLSADASPEGF